MTKSQSDYNVICIDFMFSILKYLSAKIIFTQMIAISVPKAADHYIAIIVVFQKNARDMREYWDEKYMYQI